MPVPQQPTPRRPGTEEQDSKAVPGQPPLDGEGDRGEPRADRTREWESYNSDILSVFFDV